MKQHLDQFKKLTITARLSLFVTVLLLVTIGITVNNALTRQERRTRAASNNSSAYNTPTPSCSPRPACLDAAPKCTITEPSNGWCPKKSTLGESSSAVVTFANNGLSEPFYWLTRPTAVFYNNKTYVVWHGAGYDPYITYYNHATKTWAQVKWVADNPMVGNGHGAPAMTIDSGGYIHVFYGATIAGGFPLKHAISDSPENISAFTVKSNIGKYNYPKPINIENELHLFVMGPNDGAFLSDLTWNGTSWKSNRPYLLESYPNSTIYVGFMEYNNNKIHMTWTYAYDEGREVRNHVFYAYLNLADNNMYSITGKNLGTTIDMTEAEKSENGCIVRWNTGSDGTNTPSMHFDSNGYPWIIYPEGSGTTWKFYHTRWNGSVWTAPAAITTTDERFNYEDFKINSVTDVTAYLNTSGEPGSGGDIEEWHWDGTKWSKVSTILSESVSGKPLGGPNIPYNFNPELDLVFSQFLDDIFTDNTLKLYAVLGVSSTTTPTPTRPTYVTPTIYCLGSCPTLPPRQILPPAPSQKTPPCSSYGDVNNDGYITTVDADLVLKYAVGSLIPTTEQKKRADVDADGIVNTSDALMILRYANGTTTTFPVCSRTPQPTLTPATPTPTPQLQPNILMQLLELLKKLLELLSSLIK